MPRWKLITSNVCEDIKLGDVLIFDKDTETLMEVLHRKDDDSMETVLEKHGYVVQV